MPKSTRPRKPGADRPPALPAAGGPTPRAVRGAPATGDDVAGIMDRARRVSHCTTEVFAAIAPILAKHHCRLGTVQEIIDGQPGAVRVVVIAND